MMEKFIGKKEKWINKGTDKEYVADSFNTQYNLSYPKFVQNFRVLSQVVPEKSLTEKSEHTHKHTEKAKTIYPPINLVYREYKWIIIRERSHEISFVAK